MKRARSDRWQAHLSAGGDVFIPHERLAAIRWEEAVVRSRARRQGLPELGLRHWTCHCGHLDCVGMPAVVRPRR